MKPSMDLYYASSEVVLLNTGKVILPCQWILTFSDNDYFQKHYKFPVRPTRKQIGQSRKHFNVCYDMFLHYN